MVSSGLSPKSPMESNTGKLSEEEQKTLALANEELKDMLNYVHLELADETLDPSHIQHNPNVPRAAMVSRRS